MESQGTCATHKSSINSNPVAFTDTQCLSSNPVFDPTIINDDAMKLLQAFHAYFLTLSVFLYSTVGFAIKFNGCLQL